MSKIQIIIDLKDEDFAIMYARRLAELSPGLSITISKEKGVIHQESKIKLTGCEDDTYSTDIYAEDNIKAFITDRDDCSNLKERIVAILSKDCSLDKDICDNNAQSMKKFYIYSSVRDVLSYIIARYEENTGHFFGGGLFEKIKTFEFYSYCGGCGTTSVAVTFAKHLAISKEGRTLFISGNSDCLLYFKGIHKPNKHSMQLEYCIRQRRPFSLEDYLYEDEYAISYLISPVSEEIIMRVIADTGKYQYVVVDYGKVPLDWNSKIAMDVQNSYTFCTTKEGDMRCDFANPLKGQTLISNFSLITKDNRDCYSIPVDNTGFTLTDYGIKIDLFGGFGTAVRNILEGVVGEEGIC